MKTKLTLLLVLALQSASAQLPSLNPKAAAQARSGMSQSIPKPATRPSVSAPAARMPSSSNSGTQNWHPENVSENRSVSTPAKTTAVEKPLIEVKKPLPASVIPGLSNADAIREAGNIADELRSLDALRGSAVGNAAADFGLPGTTGGGRGASPQGQFENSALGGMRPEASGGDDLLPSGLAGGSGNQGGSRHFSSDSLSTPSMGSIRRGLASNGPATGSAGDSHTHTETGADGTRSSTRETHSDGTTTAKTVVVGTDGSQQIFSERRADKNGDGVAETVVGRHIEHRRSDGSSSSQDTSRNPDGTYTTVERSSSPGSATDERRSTTSRAPAPMPLPGIRTDRSIDPDATPHGGSKFSSPGHRAEEPAIVRARKRPGTEVNPDENSTGSAASAPRMSTRGLGPVINPGTVDMVQGSGGSMSGARRPNMGREVNPGKDPR